MKLKRNKDTLKINSTDDITAAKVEDMRKSILDEFDSELKFIEIDLKNVKLIDSTGISLLISIQNSLNKNEGKLRITNTDENLSHMFNVMRLNNHFEIS